MKLAAIVVVYYPDLNDLNRNILSYIDDVDTLIVWDNTPIANQEKYKLDISDYQEKIQYFSTGRNEFIAYPLNKAIEWCILNDYSYLLSMDQDSLFQQGAFKLYKNKVKNNSNSKFAIFGVNPNSQFVKQKHFLEVDWFITSGSIYDVKVVKGVGGFREDFKIDCVDNEICYKVNLKGYKTVVDTECFLNQTYGSPKMTAFGFTTSGYSAFRTYSILCNHILLWKEYPKQVESKLKKIIIKDYLIYRFIKVILFERQKQKKTLALLYGVLDGLMGQRKERSF